MGQSIALQSNYYPIDLPGMEAKAQDARAMDFKLQNAPLAAEVDRMKLSDEKGKLSALEAYRGAAEKTDPYSALPEVDAYPELAGELEKAMGGMDPEARRAATKKASAFAGE